MYKGIKTAIELNYQAIGKRIKRTRIRQDITQERLAEAAGLSVTHMSNIETGSTRVSLASLVRIANALSVSPNDLLCEDVLQAQAQIEKEIALLLEDCDEYEIRMMRDLLAAMKETLRRDAALRERIKGRREAE